MTQQINVQKIVEQAFGGFDEVAVRGSAAHILYESAIEIHRLQKTLIRSSRDMAERFMFAADQLEAGNTFSDPTGYSTHRDITENASKLEVQWSVFKMALHGIEATKRDAIRTALGVK